MLLPTNDSARHFALALSRACVCTHALALQAGACSNALVLPLPWCCVQVLFFASGQRSLVIGCRIALLDKTCRDKAVGRDKPPLRRDTLETKPP